MINILQNKPAWNNGKPSHLKGKKKKPETIEKMKRNCKRGQEHYLWNGGKKLAIARHRNRRRQKGFILITYTNPYNEPIDYHHIHPDLPYVVPCPQRIHDMFPGACSHHFEYVNLILGIRVPEELLIKKEAPQPKTIDEIEYEKYIKKLRTREYNRKYLKDAMSNISFTETIAENIMLYEGLFYNNITGHVTVSSFFRLRPYQYKSKITGKVLTAPESQEEIKDIEKEFYPDNYGG